MGEFVSTLGNPWLAEEYSVTMQGVFFQKYGARRAEQFAEIARKANALAPKTAYRTTIITRKITESGGGGSGGLVGAGSSGDGPPEG
jgi:hypothetical protein